MRLYDWLLENNVRLYVQINVTLDPARNEPRWRCDIVGFPDPDRLSNRPAVFLMDSRGRHRCASTGWGDTPLEAYVVAVGLLSGRKVSVILRDRDEEFTIPDVTP